MQVIRWRARLRDAVCVRICARHHGVKLGLQHNCCHVGRGVFPHVGRGVFPHACKSGVLACATPCVHVLMHVTTVLKVVRTNWPPGRAYPYLGEATAAKPVCKCSLALEENSGIVPRTGTGCSPITCQASRESE